MIQHSITNIYSMIFRAIIWHSTFLNLYISIDIQRIYHVVKARRKVNIPVFRFKIVNTSKHSQKIKKTNTHFSTLKIQHLIRSYSYLKVILGSSYSFMRVFAALKNFREMNMSLQIMRVNKQKVLQHFHHHIVHESFSHTSSKTIWGFIYVSLL